MSLTGAAQVAISATTGALYVWMDGQLYAYEPEGSNYRLTKEAKISEESQRAVLAAAGEYVVVARADGAVQVLDAKSVRSALSIMATCGAYDPSGRRMKDVGIPMKSGVRDRS